jgi:serine/threonine protein kinase
MNRLAYLLFAVIAIAVWVPGGSPVNKLIIAHAADEAVVSESTETSSPADERPSIYEKFKAAAANLLKKLGIDYEFAKLYATWIVGAPTLVVVLLITMMLFPRRKRKPPSKIKRPIRLAPRKKPETSAVDIKKPGPATDKERVLELFVQMFKAQVGAVPDASTQIVLVESRPTCPNDTYEMRVKTGKDWASRRMSIGLLGQGGGSRSKCFYVIYDSHMVLKIPTKPIPEFSVYREKIKAEARIVGRLYPRECIVPRIGVILKAVYTMPDWENLPEDAQEDKYVHLMEVNPEYQEYLKIGSSFAFFMDLSRHFFLSTTLEEIHRGDQRIVTEALKQQELLWDQHGFVCRYGEDAGGVCHELQDAYYRCEGRLRKLVNEAQIIEDIPTFQLKQWYLTHLSGEEVDAGTEDLPEELVGRVNKLLGKVIQENYPQVAQYRKSVRSYIKEMRFSQHRIQLENLASNTLNLLAWIDDKDLAMRDLKPENLFVAGEPKSYPLFLNDTRKFSIGLIDVETAVVMDTQSSKEIPQPQLAGTPLYATPTHLLNNTLLEEIYGDVAAILHMQDWYATIAIIFKIISGRNLFSSTAMLFPEMVKQIRILDPAGPEMDKEMAQIHQMFWGSARGEFKENLKAYKDILERIEVAVPRSMVPTIIKALHGGCNHISSALAGIVSQQSVFTGKEKCQYLLDASVEKIGMMKRKLIREKPGSIQRNQQRERALQVLDRIEDKKVHLQRKLEAAAALKTKVGTVPADQLLEAMFGQVYHTMYLSHWPTAEPVQWKAQPDADVDIATYQATIV